MGRAKRQSRSNARCGHTRHINLGPVRNTMIPRASLHVIHLGAIIIGYGKKVHCTLSAMTLPKCGMGVGV